MIGAHVGDHRHVGARHGDSAAQDAAAGGLENGRLRARIAHHQARTGRAGIIARGERLFIDEYAVGAVVARRPAVGSSAGGEQPHGRGLAVRAGDQRRRDVVRAAPRHRADARQVGQREAAPACARTQREQRLVQDVRQAARRSRLEQRRRRGVCLARRRAAGSARSAADSSSTGAGSRCRLTGIPGGFERRRDQCRLEGVPAARGRARRARAHSAHSLISVARNS